MTFRADVRSAAMTLLDAYKAAHPTHLRQTYPGRPKTITPPCAYVEGIREPSITYTPAGTNRLPEVSVRIVKGTFDDADTVAAMDALVDGFIAYVVDNRHAAGANTLFLVTGYEDEDDWVPPWMDPEKQLPFYTTVVTLQGEGTFGGIT